MFVFGDVHFVLAVLVVACMMLAIWCAHKIPSKAAEIMLGGLAGALMIIVKYFFAE